MTTRLPPDAIDSRLVLQIYSCVFITLGVFVYLWPLVMPERFLDVLQLSGIPAGGRWSLTRVIAAAVACAGCCAGGMGRISQPVDRRRALYWFAAAHALFGAMFWIQWFAVYDRLMPPIVGWTPLLIGAVLLYVAATGSPAPRARMMFGGADDRSSMRVDVKPGAIDALQAQFDEQIARAARQEERTRLARDLHDAIKQQLFVVQTAAATIDARFDADREGARTALTQVRTAAHEAMREMEAMIDQLNTTPVENVGLVDALKRQCEALQFRTGAEVSVRIGELPPNHAVPAGAQHALFRSAQEALANVGRHARASHVSVSLGTQHGRLELSIVDDGVGFDPVRADRGMGLGNMSARTMAAGGAIAVTSAPGRGTSVHLSVPLLMRPLRTYLIRAIISAAMLVAAAAYIASRGIGDQPWMTGIAAVAAIATARYAAACWRVLGRGRALA
jgi:signal transduction histidine kinase